jgi:chromosome segregation protein
MTYGMRTDHGMKLAQDLAAGEGRMLVEDERRRPGSRRRRPRTPNAPDAPPSWRLAKATADHAGSKPDVAHRPRPRWRQPKPAGAACEGDARRLGDQRAAPARRGRTIRIQTVVTRHRPTAEDVRPCAGADPGGARRGTSAQRRCWPRCATRPASALATSAAELAGIEREWQALARDREARAKQAAGKHGLPVALDKVAAEPGYERALAAVLGRDAKAPLGAAPDDAEGRFWTGAKAPPPVANSLSVHVRGCPPQLAARLALVHVAERDDGRALKPGEWLVTREGRLRRWDGFVARGEGAAEAARLEAENRFAALDAVLPARREAAARADAADRAAQEELAELQRTLVAAERETQQAAEAERYALRALDQAEAARERLATRAEELAAAEAGLAEQREQAQAEVAAAKTRKRDLPDPEIGRAALVAAQAKNEAARALHQSAAAALAAHDQGLAVARERVSNQRGDIAGWEARASDAARRLSYMEQRFAEIAEERTVVAAKPASLMREIEGGEAVRARLGQELAFAETAVATAGRRRPRRRDNSRRGQRSALRRARGARRLGRARRERGKPARGDGADLGRAFPVPSAHAVRALRVRARASGPCRR